MTKWAMRSPGFALCAAAVIAAAAAGCAVVKKGESKGISSFTLDNGMKVILEELHSSPVVAMEVWVRAGGADEKPEEAGIAHLFEHMLFKGTAKRKVGEISREIEARGGDINAFTSYDHTAYVVKIPSRHFDAALDVLSDAVINSAFDPEELKKEAQVVLEEIRRAEDNPDRKIFKKFMADSFLVHPYGRPVIGYREVVEKITRESMVAFHKKWYVPDNMILVAVGDFSEREALTKVKAAFGGLKRSEGLARKRPEEPVRKGLKVSVISEQVKEAKMYVGFPVPGMKEPDSTTLDVVSDIIGRGQTSRLYRELKVRRGLVREIGTYNMGMKDPGAFTVEASLEAGNILPAIEETLRILKKSTSERPTALELSKTKLGIESGLIYESETFTGRSRNLGVFEADAGDYRFLYKYLDGIRSATEEQVLAAAGKYFVPQSMTITVLVPESEKSVTVEKITEIAGRVYKQEPGKEAGGDGIVFRRLDNGVRVIVREDHTAPIVSIQSYMRGGQRDEGPGEKGMFNLMARMLSKGTATRSREQFSLDQEAIAGSVGGFAGVESVGLSGRFLSKYLDQGIDLYFDALRNPAFDPKEMEKERGIVLNEIKNRDDSPRAVAYLGFIKALFGEHPYGVDPLGTREAVGAIKAREMAEKYAKCLVSRNLVIAVSGDVKSDDIFAKIGQYVAGLKDGGYDLARTPKLEAPARQVEVSRAMKGKEQAQVYLGFLGASYKNEERYTLDVLSAVLSGMSGRLFVELRDKRNLAYAVFAYSAPMDDPGMFIFYIGCDPRKMNEAMEGFKREINRIRTEPVTDEELDKAKNSLIGDYEMSLQSNGTWTTYLGGNESAGLGYRYHEKYVGIINAVTKEKILESAKKYLSTDAYVVSVVKPE
jgi:zinc protease